MSPQSCFAAPLSLASRSFTPLSTNVCERQLSTAVSKPSLLPKPKNVINMAFTSIGGILTSAPVSVPGDTAEVVKAVYKQVFGNAHLMASELIELETAESEFEITKDVRNFIRAIAMSEQYQDRFFHSVSQYRFVELAFKHFLGRAPESAAEYAEAMACYNEKGYEAFVSHFIDSEEYEENFGSSIVPYGIYKGCYSSNELFNRSVALRLSPAESDKGRNALLNYCVLSGDSPSWLAISKALPPGTEKGTGFKIGSYWQSSKRNEKATIRNGTRIPGGVVFS